MRESQESRAIGAILDGSVSSRGGLRVRARRSPSTRPGIIAERFVRTTGAEIRSVTAMVLGFLICLSSCSPALALDRDRSIGQFYYTFWGEKNGAPSGITALAQTADGYLWIGSERGLFRFDGVKFEQYKPQPGVELPSYAIYDLMPTPDGGLWIAFSPAGLAFLKQGVLTVFSREHTPESPPVHCFARDHEGIWAGTEDGLVLLQGGRLIPIGQEWNLPREMIRYVLVDREGTLWVATVNRIAFLRPGSKKFELGGAVGTDVTTLAQAKSGRVWFADSRRGEVRPVPLGGHNPETEFPAIVGNGLHELLFDRDGALWVTRIDFGVIRIRYPEKLSGRKYSVQDPEVESFSKNDGFSGGAAYKLLEDREGNIWVGCSEGLIQFRHNDVLHVGLPEGYQKLTLLAGSDGALWVGTTNKKPLLHIRGENIIQQKAGEQVCSVFRDRTGDIWWGGRTGMWRQRGAEFKYFPLPQSTVPDWMYHMVPSHADGGLWVKVGDVGFVHFLQGVWNFHDWPKGVPSVGGTFRYGPSAGYVDAPGNVWLGYTSGQVVVIGAGNVTVYSKKDGLDVGRIKVIRGLGQEVWAGGELGLVFFSKGRFWRATGPDGESFGAISGIIETPDSGLWLNEMKGIVHIPQEEVRKFIRDPNQRVNYRRFDYLDGFPGGPQMQFTDSSAVQTRDGRLWFGTDNGLAMVDPAHLVKNTVPPPVSIESISNENGRQPISDAIRFAAGTHMVEIHYSALSFSIPERVKFRYKLEGVDTEWRNVDTRRQAYYNSLGPGRYRFRVIACNNDGVWNNAGASLDFTILPTYYQTNWFRGLCVAAFLGLLWAAYQVRARQLQEQETRFREAVETMPALAFVARPDSYRTFVNRGWVEYTGLTLEQASGSGWQAAVHPDDLKRVIDKWQTAAATGEPLEYETRLRRGVDEEYRWFQTRAKPLRDKHGKVVKWCGVATDIEDRRRAEEEHERLRQIEAELAHINRVSTLGELAASIAHEVNQPLSGIVSNGSACLRFLAGDPPNVAEVREAIRDIVRDGKRAGEVIARIRAMTKRAATARERLDLNETIQDVLALAGDEAKRKSVIIQTQFGGDLSPVAADRVQLQQVILNLVMNAIEAMSSVGDRARELVITTRNVDLELVQVTVEDSGIGIDSQTIDKIFDSFYTTKPGGMGMGLSISRSILQAHGGRLWATVNDGRGTSFHFTLPKYHDEEPNAGVAGAGRNYRNC